MRKLLFVTLLSMAFIGSFAQSDKEITLPEIVSGKYNGESIHGIVPMADGKYYTRMSDDNKRVVEYSFETGKEVGVLFDVDKARNFPEKSFDGYIMSQDNSKLLIRVHTKKIYRRSFTADYYIAYNTSTKVDKLSENGAEECPVFSPDGNMVAFVRNNNIFLIKLLYDNSESQVTTDGEINKVLNGKPDWVNEEEFEYNCALTFSPDNSMICWTRFDETNVPSFSFPLYKGQEPEMEQYDRYPGTYTYKYPKTGEPNSIVSVCSFDIKSHVIRKLKLPLRNDDYVPRIHFTDDPAKLAVIVVNRAQNNLNIYMTNPRSGVARLVLNEKAKYYIDDEVYDNIKFYNDNFSFLSERDGYTHLYWYTLGGTLVKKVTAGDYEVKKFYGWNPETDSFYYLSNEGDSRRSAVYEVNAKGKKSCITPDAGTNDAIFSADFKSFINVHSSLNEVPKYTLNVIGKRRITLEDNAELKSFLATKDLPAKEFFTVNSNGETLNGWMIKPLNFDANKKYPVILYQYSGPKSQQVLDSWDIGMQYGGACLEEYWAQQGFIVACVDGRGTGGRGEAFSDCTYLQLGVKESQDQNEVANYMASLPYVDKNNIGIWGWSYGAYCTLMSLTEPNSIFKAGVAVAPVTDWKYYDSIYGERFMRTPKENGDGYKASSAFTRAGNLKAKLLIMHGLADDNVHFQNTAEYGEQLVQLGKQYDQQVFNNRNHGISGGNTRLYLFTRLTDFFKDNLCERH